MANPLFSLFGNKMGSEAGLLGDLAMSLFGQNQQQPQPVQPQATTDPSQLTGQQQPPQAPPPGPASYPTFNAGLQSPVPPPGQFAPQPVPDFAGQDTMIGGTGGDRFGAPEAAPEVSRYAPDSVQGEFYQGMIDRGIPAHIAEGFMMNAADESSFNPIIEGDDGNAKGLLQLNGPRKRAFEAQYGDDWSVQNQLDFLTYELDGPESANYSKILKAQTPGEAAALIVDHFERPSEENRIERRNRYLGGEGQDVMVGGTGGEGGDQFVSGDESIDYSELEDEVDDWTPEEQNRQAKWAGIGAFSKGLGQMSRGDAIDVGDVFNDLTDRQREARERKSEIAKLKIQERIDQRSHKWAIEQEKRGYEHAETVQERQFGYDTKTIAAAHSYDEGQVEKFRTGVDKVAAESQDPLMKRAAEMVKASNYTLTFADAVKELAPDEKSAKLKEFSEYQRLLVTDPDAAAKYYDYLTAPTTSLTDTVANTKAKALISDTSNRVTKGREALDKSLATRPALENIKTVLDVARQQGVELTGPVSAQTQTIRTAMAEMGIPLDTDINIAMQSAIQSAGAQLRPIIRAPGEQSNAELADTVTSLPGLADSPLANQFKVQAMEGDLAYRESKQNALETYRAENENGTDTGFDKYWKDMETAGLTPINYIDYGIKTDRSLENAARMYQQGLLQEGSIILDRDPKGNKYFRPITGPEIQSLSELVPQLDLIDRIPYPWEKPQEAPQEGV